MRGKRVPLNSKLILRPETPSDYAAIARVHARAFNSGSVPSIVALQRERTGFRPEMSIVGEIDGKMAGHVLFMPETIRLLDRSIAAVVVSPVGVAPEFQRQGIGSALMQEGHRTAREHGFTVSILLGHPEYYPRFGYRQYVYGSSSLTVQKNDLPDNYELSARLPTEGDLPALKALWLAEEGAIDFAIQPEDTLLAWLSPNEKLNCRVFERADHEIAGYARYYTQPIITPTLFLARDDEAARRLAAILCKEQDAITLPLHPSSRSASAFAGTPIQQAWSAAMACPLESGALDAFCAALETGERLPGRVVWPPPFDCAE